MIGGLLEGKRSWWVGRASNPVGGAMRRRVGSTPIPFRPWLEWLPHHRLDHAGQV